MLKAPVRTPVANTFAERWIGTQRRELPDRNIIWNPRQVEGLVTDFIAHHNQHRPHRSLDQQPPQPAAAAPPTDRTKPTLRVVRNTRCDGLINEYRTAA
ncbi:MAG: transposase [Actinomycetia bacterium]|nr:transposase [Actinomycetes bacterium]